VRGERLSRGESKRERGLENSMLKVRGIEAFLMESSGCSYTLYRAKPW
jgi:hypothetical protein